jgi:hypothetical protein
MYTYGIVKLHVASAVAATRQHPPAPLSITVPAPHHVVETKPTANCIIIDHFSAFEPGLVAPFLYAACKNGWVRAKTA